MAKVCKHEECNYPVWGGGYCKYHQSMRTDKRPKKISRLSSKGRIRKQKKYDLIEKDKEFYMQIWNSRGHFCFETGIYLGDEPLMTYFHHVLEKSKYPEFRHEDWNIVLLRPEVHNQVHTNIDKTPKVKYLTQILREAKVNEQSTEDSI